MLPYTKVIAGSSTNVTDPTTEEINQGNNQLTPYNSAVNNGYYLLMSQGISNISSEIQNVITAGGVTPSADNNNLITALNNLYPAISALGTAAYVNVGTADNQIPLLGTVKSQITAQVRFGSWSSIAINSIIQAASDGFIVGYDPNNSGGFNILTDSSPTPTTIRSAQECDNFVNPGGTMSPVKKNDYYKITPLNGSSFTE